MALFFFSPELSTNYLSCLFAGPFSLKKEKERIPFVEPFA